MLLLRRWSSKASPAPYRQRLESLSKLFQSSVACVWRLLVSLYDCRYPLMVVCPSEPALYVGWD